MLHYLSCHEHLPAGYNCIRELELSQGFTAVAEVRAAEPGCALLHCCFNYVAGSEYKIDASYLSPNVNLASRLEAATKQYSVPLLLSKHFVDCLSPSVRAKVRVTAN